MRILWLKTELLHPVDKGGRIRTYQMLRELKRSHHVTYLTLDDGTAAPDAVERAAEYCDELIRIPFRRSANFSPRFWIELLGSLVSRLPYTIRRYRSAAFRAAVERAVESERYDVVVCDFLTPAVNVPRGLPCAAVLFEHNVEAAIWRRHYEVERNPLRKAMLRLEWLKVRRFEAKACREFDHVIAVSEDDRCLIGKEYGVEASAVPTGVDVEYFRPSGSTIPRKRHLVFTGSMDWLPNIDGMKFFVQDILPRIRRRAADVSLTIVGRDPTPEIAELGRGDAGVTVTGRVPDVRPYIEEAAAFIVPLRVGGGTRLKIFEAMAMERPVVSTRVGAEGLPVQHERDVLLADDPEEFADAIISVLDDAECAAVLARNGAVLVRENFGWARAADVFAGICERVAGAGSARGDDTAAAEDNAAAGGR